MSFDSVKSTELSRASPSTPLSAGNRWGRWPLFIAACFLGIELIMKRQPARGLDCPFEASLSRSEASARAWQGADRQALHQSLLAHGTPDCRQQSKSVCLASERRTCRCHGSGSKPVDCFLTVLPAHKRPASHSRKLLIPRIGARGRRGGRALRGFVCAVRGLPSTSKLA